MHQWAGCLPTYSQALPDQETPSPIAEGQLQQRNVSPDIPLPHVDVGAFDVGGHGDTDWLDGSSASARVITTG